MHAVTSLVRHAQCLARCMGVVLVLLLCGGARAGTIE
jgi:hypothetical protein